MFTDLLPILLDENRWNNVLSSLSNEAKEIASSIKTFMSTEFVDNGENYTMTVAIGENVKDEDIKIKLDDNTLTVRYSSKTKHSSMSNSFTESLPTDADADTLDAFVEDGILTITMDKVKPSEAPKAPRRRIAVKK